MVHVHIGNAVVEQLEVLIHIHILIHVQKKAELYMVVYVQGVIIVVIVEQSINIKKI